MRGGGTLGSVEAFGSSYFINKIKKQNGKTTSEKSFAIYEPFIKAEVKVKGSGLSFGGKIKNSYIEVPMKDPKSFLPTSTNVFLKYDLPELNKVNSYLKTDVTLQKGKSNIALEGDLSIKINDNLNFGLNSKTELPFNKPNNPADAKEYRDLVYTTNKLYLKGYEDKDNIKDYKFKNVEANLETQYTYSKKAEEAFRYIALNAKGTYAGIKDLQIGGKFDFVYSFVNVPDGSNGTIEYIEAINGKKNLILPESISFSKTDILNLKYDYNHSYDLELKYKGFETSIFAQHKNKLGVKTLDYGLYLGYEHKFNNNLILGGKALFLGNKTIEVSKDITRDADVYLKLIGKYEYKPSDKFTLIPELNGILAFQSLNKNKTKELIVTPAVSLKYTPTKNLELKATLEVPNEFDNLKYRKTTVGTKINLKYMWE